jgi:hypothetical protein
VCINTAHCLQMEGANGISNWTIGCVEYLPMQIGGVPFSLHAHVEERTPFHLLLGCPFQHLLNCCLKDLPNGSFEVSICNLCNHSHHIYVPSRPQKSHMASSIWVISYTSYTTSPSITPYLAYQPTLTTTPPSPPAQPHVTNLAYKKVAKKVCPVPASLPKEFCNMQCIPKDPLLSLPSLPIFSPDFSPGSRLSKEQLDDLQLNWYNFLCPKSGLAWTKEEKGHFCGDYFSPVKIPVIKHIPWLYKNIPIPSSILDKVIQIFKDKYTAEVYEHSDASYCSCFFCVKKKSGALHLVHNLQPLNAVTICNSGVPPLANQLIEAMAGHSCYSMLDLFVGYDYRTLDASSCDLTTIQSPIGALRLTALPSVAAAPAEFQLEPEPRSAKHRAEPSHVYSSCTFRPAQK